MVVVAILALVLLLVSDFERGASVAPETAVVGTESAQSEILRAPPSSRVGQRVSPVEPEDDADLARGDAVLWFEVVAKETGSPLSEVLLDLVPKNFGGFRQAEGTSALEGRPGFMPSTGSDGSARFRMPPGEYVLNLYVEGRDTEKVALAPLTAGEERTQRIELVTTDDLSLRGLVRAGAGGPPLAGAEVVLFRSSSWGSHWPRFQATDIQQELVRTVTDSEGRFRLQGASWRSFVLLRAAAPGFASAYQSVGADSRAEFVLELEPAARLQGNAVGNVPGLEVRLSGIGESWSRSAEPTTGGTFAFEELPAGLPFEVWLEWGEPATDDDYDFIASEDRRRFRVESRLALEPGESRSAEWSVPPLCRVRGRAVVLPERTPFAGWLTLERYDRGDGARETTMFEARKYPDSFRSAADGTFELEALPPGGWRLGSTYHERESFRPIARRFEIASAQQDLELLVEVEPTPFVAGVVLAPDGRPVPRAEIEALRESDSIYSAKDGTFRMPLFVSDETELQASARGYAESEWKAVRAGDVGIELRLQRGATVRVSVLDGGAPAKATVLVLGDATGARFGLSEPEDGEHVFSELPPGRYTLVATGGGRAGWLFGFELAEGASASLTLALTDIPAELELRGDDAAFMEVRVSSLGHAVASEFLSRAEGSRVLVPAGPCEVRWSDNGFDWHSRRVEGVTGSVTVVALASDETR